MRLLADMEVFVEAAKMRNFGRAAAALGITPSTLSRRISGLERELGFVLIRRSTRHFALTEAGQKFLERSQRILEEAARTREELGADFTKISGHVRVGAPCDLATTILASVFARYCRANPTVSIDVISTQGQPDLSRDSLDVAFAVAHQVSLPDSLYSARLVGSFARMMYASRTYLKRNATPNTPPELIKHSCIRHLDGPVEKHWELHRERRRQIVAVKGAFTCSSVSVSAQAAREHLGIVMIPQHLASHPTFGAGLVRVLPDWEGTRASVFAVTADRILPARTEELIRVAKAEFAKQLAKLESAVA